MVNLLCQQSWQCKHNRHIVSHVPVWLCKAALLCRTWTTQSALNVGKERRSLKQHSRTMSHKNQNKSSLNRIRRDFNNFMQLMVTAF